MKTAVSIPNPIFEAADRLARQQGRSRSELYATALADYLRRHDDNAVTAAWDAVVAEIGDSDFEWVHRAARRVVARARE
jgi:metal-responsive CopG/Arc/MetJ family transcriptional regulator